MFPSFSLGNSCFSKSSLEICQFRVPGLNCLGGIAVVKDALPQTSIAA